MTTPRQAQPFSDPRNCVFQDREGWHAMVNGRVYGTWELKAYAEAGLQVEQRRLSEKIKRDIAIALHR